MYVSVRVVDEELQQRVTATETAIMELLQQVMQRRAQYPALVQSTIPPLPTMPVRDESLNLATELAFSSGFLEKLTESCAQLNALNQLLPATIGKLERARTVIRDEERKISTTVNNNASSLSDMRSAKQRRASRQFEMASKLLSGN